MSSAISLCPEFDRHELLIYEEVARMPPFRRKTLVLIGAQGVGRRSLKNKLIMWDPDRYGTTVPCEWEPGPAVWGLCIFPFLFLCESKSFLIYETYFSKPY